MEPSVLIRKAYGTEGIEQTSGMWIYQQSPYSVCELCPNMAMVYGISGNLDKTNDVYIDAWRTPGSPISNIHDAVTKFLEDHGVEFDPFMLDVHDDPFSNDGVFGINLYPYISSLSDLVYALINWNDDLGMGWQGIADYLESKGN